MFPLKIALASGPDNKFSINNILSKMFAPVEADFDSIDELCNFQGELPFCLLLCEVRNESDLQQLERIGNRYPGYPAMAIVDLSLDCSMIVRTMRAGAAQVVQTPLDEEDFTTALNRIAVQYGFSLQSCRSIAVLGSKEGCGATTLAINLAHQIALQTPNKKTALIEANPTFGCMAMRLGLEPVTTVGDLIRNPDTLSANEVLDAGEMLTPNLQVLPGPHNRILTKPAITSMILRLIGYACEYSNTVVIDMPYQYSPVYLNILREASDILIVGEQSISSIHNMQVLSNMLVENQIPALRHIVVNKYQKRMKDFHSEIIRNLLNTDSIFLVEENFKMVSKAENNGQVLTGSGGILNDLRDLGHFFRLEDSSGDPLTDVSSATAAFPNPTFSLQ